MPDVSKIEACREVHEFTQMSFDKDLKPQLTDLDITKQWLDRLQGWDRIIGQNIRTQYLQGFINIVGKGLRETLVGKVKKEQANIRSYLYE